MLQKSNQHHVTGCTCRAKNGQTLPVVRCSVYTHLVRRTLCKRAVRTYPKVYGVFIRCRKPNCFQVIANSSQYDTAGTCGSHIPCTGSDSLVLNRAARIHVHSRILAFKVSLLDRIYARQCVNIWMSAHLDIIDCIIHIFCCFRAFPLLCGSCRCVCGLRFFRSSTRCQAGNHGRCK